MGVTSLIPLTLNLIHETIITEQIKGHGIQQHLEMSDVTFFHKKTVEPYTLTINYNLVLKGK